MEINLNKQLVSKEGILKYIQEIDVYRFYTNKEIQFNTSLLSPLRNDKKPSFGYYKHKSTNEIFFNDFVLGTGDFVVFVQRLFGINYFEALSKIAIDFNLTNYFDVKNIKKTSKDYDPNKYDSKEILLAKINNFKIRIKKREWQLYDLKYWLEYGVDIEILNKYNVYPLQYIFITSNEKTKIITCDKFSYAFIENKDGLETYKIYQPFNVDYKWLNNHDHSVWQGWRQLPEKGDILIITKSLKDVMSIVNNTNYPSVSLQTESCWPKEHILKELYSRFETIFLLYDNDFDKEINWGQKFSNKLSEKYSIFNIKIDDQYKSKDFSDLFKNLGKEIAVKILKETIENFVPF